MLPYCLKCTKKIESKSTRDMKTKNKKILHLSNCVVLNSKKSRFIKQQEASGLLNALWIMTPLCKIPSVGLLLF